MATYWTLEYSGSEKTLYPGWGVAQDMLRLERSNQAPDVLTVSIPVADADMTPIFAYGEEVIVRRDRASADGSDDSFSAGTIYFRGKATTPTHAATGTAMNMLYKFNGPWWDLQRLVFQQEWKAWDHWTTPGDATTPAVYVTQRTSELFLGQKFDGTAQNTGEGIAEALAWAISCGVALQVGDIDPAVAVPTYNIRDQSVAEVVIQLLRWSPDVVTWFDYTTSPPTLNAKAMANLDVVTLTKGVDKISTAELTPRYDLQLAAVVLRFKSTNEENGTALTTITTQKYPLLATGTELQAQVSTIELAGYKRTRVYASIECETNDSKHATLANRVAWWQKKDPLFTSDKIDAASLSITVATVTDDSGSAVSLTTYPRELTKGQIADWLSFSQKHIIVKAIATYDLYTVASPNQNAAKLVEKGRTKELSVRIVATDGTTGDYAAVKSFEAAEAIPAGLAESIYNSHAVLRYEGNIALTGATLMSGIGVGNCLAISGASEPWENLLVQRSSEEPFTGRINLSVGPPNQLGISDLIELLRVNRHRLIYNMPSSRVTGEVGGGGEVGLGKELPKENTTTGLGNREAQSVTKAFDGSNTIHVGKDAGTGNGMLFLGIRKDSDGTIDAAQGGALLQRDDTLGSDGNYHQVTFQECEFCFPEIGRKRFIMPISDAFDPPAP